MVLAVALVGSGAAHAKDACFMLPGLGGGLVFVAKTWKPPGKNKCKPVQGFTEIAGWLLDGVACTKADGSALRLTLAGHPLDLPGPTPFQIGCTVPLPSLTGGTCRGTYHSGSDVFGVTSGIDMQDCVVAVP